MFDYLLFKRVARARKALEQGGASKIDNQNPVYFVYQAAHRYLYDYSPYNSYEQRDDVNSVLNETYTRLVCSVNPFLFAKLLKRQDKSISYLESLIKARDIVRISTDKIAERLKGYTKNMDYPPLVKSGNRNVAALDKEIAKRNAKNLNVTKSDDKE